ncbi:MAG: cysteine protease [Gemmatimonadales bacterium]|nr:cysteine protease [Gemmatimonadales bacterium]NIQ99280.1 cysteine protease [Gemmatimonadales bacterium]
MTGITELHGMGWMPDLPDIRDFTQSHEQVDRLMKQMKVKAKAPTAFPNKMDLRGDCAPVEDQQTIGSCTAQAGVGLVEYFERRASGEHIDASRLFLYKVTRNLLGWTGDTGAFLRTTMGAMVLFGVPPEKYWPYRIARYDEEPSTFLYAFAENYKAIKYYRLDPPGTDRQTLLTRIKYLIAAHLPCMFGFTVYSSITQAEESGEIPFPEAGDKRAGGHAVVAVGYEDKRKIGTHTGALLIRNSWGEDWGEDGYGYLPYQYVLSGLAVDWWSLIQAKWVDTGKFGF